jgi:hypothetical protein
MNSFYYFNLTAYRIKFDQTKRIILAQSVGYPKKYLKRKEGPLDPKIKKLQEEICLLQQEKAEREAALPAHSIRPHQLLIIEDLEEKITQKEEELKSLTGET